MLFEVTKMKKIYTTPEATLVCFGANEKLASNTIDFDKLWRLGQASSGEIGGKSDPSGVSGGDVNLDS